jgi:hypothetical protein
MPTIPRHCRSGSPGQAIVEFGIIILLLLLIVGAGFDLGLFMAAQLTMTAATGEAARRVAYGTEPEAVFSTTQQLVSGSLVPGGVIAIRISYCVGGPATPLPCAARGGESFCAGPTPIPAPPSNVISGNPGCYPSGTSFADVGSNAPQPGDWALVTLTDSSWELFSPLTNNLMRVYGGDCTSNGSCVTTIRGAQLVVYPGTPPTP